MNLRGAWPYVKFAVSAALLAFLLSRLGTEAMLRAVRDASPWLPVAAVLMLTLQTALSAGKWLLLLREQGVLVGYGSLLKTYLIGNFINLFMPSVVGGDAYRAVRLSHQTNGVLKALPSIIVDRLTGIVALLVVGVTGLTLFVAPHLALPVVVAQLVTLLIVYGLALGPVRRLCERLAPESFFGLARLAKLLVSALTPSVTLLCVVGLAFLFQVNTVLINWIYTQLIGLEVPLSALLLIVPIVYLAEAVPISINGLGVREATYAAMFLELGLPAEQGVLLGLTVSLMRYVAGTVGGVLLAADTLRSPQATAGS
jgi:glycosyltransferase 2 family protein